MTSSSSEGAERFLPVVGSESAAAADVVAGVRGGRGGRCCSGVWKVAIELPEGESMVILFY